MIIAQYGTVFQTGSRPFSFRAIFVPEHSRALLGTLCVMKRKTKIPENIWNIICTAAIIAVLALAAYAVFR